MRILYILLVITTTFINAQIDTLWTKTFGGEFEDRGYGIVQTNDGGYIIAGRKGTAVVMMESGYKAWILKTDSQGNKEWDIEIGDSLQNVANSIIKTQDGNYVIGICKNGSEFQQASFSSTLMKIDDLGNTIWEVDYPDSVAGWMWDLKSTSDNGFVFTGGEYLVMTDSIGNILWSKKDPLWVDGISVTTLSDGGVILTTNQNDVIKYNRDGVEVWENEQSLPTQIWSLIETPSGLIGVGTDYSSGYLVAFSPTGEVVIETILDEESQWLYDIVKSNDGGYYICGSRHIDDVEFLLIMKITFDNQQPEILWSKVYGGEASDRAYGMILSNEGNITIAGRTSSYGNGLNDLWLLKMTPEGPIVPPTVMINEFLALNGSCCTDVGGDNDDYIELYNYGETVIDIAGLYITDNVNNQQSYHQIPAGNNSTVIQPREFLLLWADKEPEQGVLHVDIKLNGDGEQIGLIMPNGNTIIDVITFYAQDTDISYGRYPDGGQNWGFMNPTPNGSNTEMLEIEEGTSLPNSFKLFTNHPNPFNPVTTLRYDLPEDAMVNITIYDMMGRKINTLVSSHQTAGFKSIQWDATNNQGQPVSAGVYLYSIQAGQFSQTKKMVLLK